MDVHDNVPALAKIEVEFKLRLADRAAFARRLQELGARLIRPRELEDNVVYDFPDRGLTGRGSMLRARTLDQEVVLTFKGRAQASSIAKRREEIESVLTRNEGNALVAILERLGLVPIFRYQKYRTTWELQGIHVMLDETPIGDFAELEGDEALIIATAYGLGYRQDQFITSSYRDLYVQGLSDRPGPVDSMVFAT